MSWFSDSTQLMFHTCLHPHGTDQPMPLFHWQMNVAAKQFLRHHSHSCSHCSHLRESKQGIFDCLSCTETEGDSRLWGAKQSFFLYQKSVTTQFTYITNVLSTEGENRFSFAPLLLNRLCLTCSLWFLTVLEVKGTCMKTKRALCQLKEADGFHQWTCDLCSQNEKRFELIECYVSSYSRPVLLLN